MGTILFVVFFRDSGQSISNPPCAAQVLETLKKNACTPKPFPLHEQYVPAVVAARETLMTTRMMGGQTNQRGKGGKPKKKTKAKAKGVKRQPAQK